MENKIKIKELPSLEILKDSFDLDVTSPSGLRWKSHRKFRGRAAGMQTKDGYFRVNIDKSPYFAHRIVYALNRNTTDFGDLYIDHIDRNRGNNLPENLRLVTPAENSQNKTPSIFGKKSDKLRMDNTSGFENIFFHGRDKYWVVSSKSKINPFYKSFKTFEEAKEWQVNLLQQFRNN
jgi:hypothetical protein